MLLKYGWTIENQVSCKIKNLCSSLSVFFIDWLLWLTWVRFYFLINHFFQIETIEWKTFHSLMFERRNFSNFKLGAFFIRHFTQFTFGPPFPLLWPRFRRYSLPATSLCFVCVHAPISSFPLCSSFKPCLVLFVCPFFENLGKKNLLMISCAWPCSSTHQGHPSKLSLLMI